MTEGGVIPDEYTIFLTLIMLSAYLTLNTIFFLVLENSITISLVDYILSTIEK